MSAPKPAPALRSWTLPEIPFTIEYSLIPMEEIRAAASAGVRQGGVLSGAHGGSTIRILSWLPIHLAHSRGPAFLLAVLQ